MNYITTTERLGIEKGIHQGEAAILHRLLKRRFGTVPSEYTELIQRASSDTLLVWGEKILDAVTLEEVFK